MFIWKHWIFVRGQLRQNWINFLRSMLFEIHLSYCVLLVEMARKTSIRSWVFPSGCKPIAVINLSFLFCPWSSQSRCNVYSHSKRALLEIRQSADWCINRSLEHIGVRAPLDLGGRWPYCPKKSTPCSKACVVQTHSNRIKHRNAPNSYV